jgi:FdrA protein
VTTPAPLLGSETRVVNVGLELFAETLTILEIPVVHVDWRPPAGGDPRLGALLAQATDDRPL